MEKGRDLLHKRYMLLFIKGAVSSTCTVRKTCDSYTMEGGADRSVTVLAMVAVFLLFAVDLCCLT